MRKFRTLAIAVGAAATLGMPAVAAADTFRILPGQPLLSGDLDQGNGGNGALVFHCGAFAQLFDQTSHGVIVFNHGNDSSGGSCIATGSTL